MKKKAPAVCSWCGTALRGRPRCPRGPACAKEEANHNALMKRIAKQNKRKNVGTAAQPSVATWGGDDNCRGMRGEANTYRADPVKQAPPVPAPPGGVAT